LCLLTRKNAGDESEIKGKKTKNCARPQHPADVPGQDLPPSRGIAADENAGIIGVCAGLEIEKATSFTRIFTNRFMKNHVFP
jgi:hypothetical protein